MDKYEFSQDQRLFIENMRQPFVVCQFLDNGIATLAVSKGFCELLGFTDCAQAYSDFNRKIYDDVHPDDRAMLTNAVLRFRAEDRRLEVVYRDRKKDGSGYKIIHATGEHVLTEDGQRLAHLWLTEEGDYEEYTDEADRGLNHLALRALHAENSADSARIDKLTGLPNVESFLEMVEAERSSEAYREKDTALLYINLSGMKSYNHRYGFSEGDSLLRSFARLLIRTFGVDRCCHVISDRFVVFAEEDGLEETLDLMFAKWRETETIRPLPVCVGIYPYRIEAVSAGVAFDRAKVACDIIRRSYYSSFNYFNRELNEGLIKQQYVLENFERALSENWIQVYYQPIVRAVNGKICDEEALARWIDPEGGILPPADFIPYLEDSGLIYKLDLYMLDRVLEHIKVKVSEGFHAVPHSINLSRSDFDACDMVEEIRRRVDEAGVSRSRISIEITESVLGRDFDFMKAQIERFQALGFPVWMDDFGSGYSSLEVLKSIRFDLLKFDMGFLRKLDENEDGRIILTELVRMALSLGTDTICEGVETEEQMNFLKEIGCSKMQGYYLGKPGSVEKLIEYHRTRKPSDYENPEETAYYELISGVNLYDVSVVTRGETTSLRNTYNTLPMGIIEVRDNTTRFVRTNQSYREFCKRFFGFGKVELGPEFSTFNASFMHNIVKACCEQGVRTFFDEKMPDGSIVHSFACPVGTNPVSGTTAVAIAVLSIREPNEKLMTEQILSVIEQFGEHMPGGFLIYRAGGNEELMYANKAVCDIYGCGSLEELKALTGFTFRGMVHPDDYENITASIKEQIDESRTDLDFVEYRITRRDGAVRWIDAFGHYIEYDDDVNLFHVFISDITEKHEQAESAKAMRSAVIEALTKPYDSVWLISDIETQKFELFRIDEEMEHLMPANVAVKIEKFSQALKFYSSLVLEEDRQMFLDSVTPENIVRNTETQLIYSVPFRRVFENDIRYYRVEFVRLDPPGGKTGIVAGFRNVDIEVRRNLEIQESLDHRAAVIEALTRPYDSVWLINDIEKQTFELYRVDELMSHLMPAREATKIERFSDALKFYSKFVFEEDRQKFLDAVTAENIIRNTENRMVYSVPFRRVFEDGVRQYRLEFVKLDLGSGDVNIVAGFKNVDEELS